MQSERLGAAADALAAAVADLLPQNHDPALIVSFRTALGNLLAETLGGATVMAAGAVVALDAKVDRLSTARIKQLHAIQADLDRVASRVHALEDEFLDAGTVGQLSAALHTLAVEVERLKERAAGDGSA